MKKTWVILLAPMLLAAKKDEAPIDPGPEPSFAQGIVLGEQSLKARLLDPASAQIEWPYSFTGGFVKAFLGKRQVGWFTCGQVNAKNRMGGYTGRSWFLLLINNGSVADIEIGDGGNLDMTAITCLKLMQKGVLHPAPAAVPRSASATEVAAMAASGATAAAAKGGLGVSFAPSPVGATLIEVASGSRADQAGLKPGETIESINGVGLKGLPAASMTQVIQSTLGPVTLGIVGVGSVKVP